MCRSPEMIPKCPDKPQPDRARTISLFADPTTAPDTKMACEKPDCWNDYCRIAAWQDISARQSERRRLTAREAWPASRETGPRQLTSYRGPLALGHVRARVAGGPT